MNQANLCDKVNVGDIIYYGEESFQVYQAHASIENEHALVETITGHIYPYLALDFRGHRNFVQPKPGEKNFNIAGTFYGYVKIARRTIKTVPVLFSGGELANDRFCIRNLVNLVSGDQKLYEYYHCNSYYAGQIVMERAVVVPARLAIPLGVSGFTKLELISYVIEVNGEGKLSRDQITKKVAELEGKPWIKTSNSDFFMVAHRLGKNGILRHAAKSPNNRILYGLGDKGKIMAANVIARLGPKLGYI